MSSQVDGGQERGTAKLGDHRFRDLFDVAPERIGVDLHHSLD